MPTLKISKIFKINCEIIYSDFTFYDLDHNKIWVKNPKIGIKILFHTIFLLTSENYYFLNFKRHDSDTK